ncbi:type I-E CRISPR-associated protein Cse2/CasB [uncultured Actinomyces sp.]|uniref:type I-E CRISPR-associated protein Cse2/CasB n=1 Tax=uncultured Actinomyces sp. TaxID=249061 RepID=UPI0026035450|nr:type I-E CRISPR-associated protein Cse2/CasB [uncultured Actinomyces sp.]
MSSKNGLQSRYLHNEAQAREQMAALRGAVAREPGEVPATWALTQVEVPDDAGDAPTPEEVAVHTAMTLYAVHQQSRTDPMFHPGKGLGHASRELIGPPDQENPSARKRFNALVTSTTITELRHHLRDLVSLLRARGITLDHAMLADDIVRFQRPGGAKEVRLVWARQYHSMSTADGADSASRTDRTTTPEPEN